MAGSKMIDARFIGEEFRLVSARLFAHRMRRHAAAGERGAGAGEFARIDQRQRFRADRGELRPVVAQPGELRSQLNQLIGGESSRAGISSSGTPAAPSFPSTACKGATGIPFAPAMRTSSS